jgi:FAD/FMN-containing dehydrogenase
MGVMSAMDALSRRELMRRGAVAGASALVLPEIASSSAGSAWAATRPSGMVDPPARLTGRVVRPGDPDYPAARTDWDRLFSHYPLAIVFCRTDRDALNAVAWARQHGVAVRARSGRHNLEGWSNIDGGVVIDVSEIKDLVVCTRSCTATVGAGLTQGEIVAQLGRRRFAIPTGSEASVGVVGATLGGGFGFLTREFGMSCDSLIGAEIVIASGRRGARLIGVSPGERSDLLWACRGGGGGNFGIVTSLKFRVHPLRDVAFLVARWSGLDSLHNVFDAWQRVAPRADSKLTTVLEVDRDAVALYAVLWAGTEARVRRMLHPVLSAGSPQVTVQKASWPEVFNSFNSGPRQYANWKFYSQFVTRPFSSGAIGIVRRFMQEAPSAPSNFFCSSFGGAVRQAPPGGSAFPHRNALFYSEPGAGWNGEELTTACQAWVAEFAQALRPHVNGAYVNVPNAAMAGWETAYYGPNFPRLRRIKSRYDPLNFFQFEQSIPLG